MVKVVTSHHGAAQPKSLLDVTTGGSPHWRDMPCGAASRPAPSRRLRGASTCCLSPGRRLTAARRCRTTALGSNAVTHRHDFVVTVPRDPLKSAMPLAARRVTTKGIGDHAIFGWLFTPERNACASFPEQVPPS